MNTSEPKLGHFWECELPWPYSRQMRFSGHRFWLTVYHKKFQRLRMSQHHLGISLQCQDIALVESLPAAGCSQQLADRRDHRINIGVSQQFLVVLCLIHHDNELGQFAQPFEPWIIGEQLQEVIGDWIRPFAAS